MTFLIPENKLRPKERKALMDRHKNLEEDFAWIREHKDELQEKFANKYIAVKNKTVRYDAKTMREILELMDEHDERSSDFVIEYIGTQIINVLF